MIRHDEENNVGSGLCYTLYLEYLGGLVPLLKGKKTSKIRPEFVIFDPQLSTGAHLQQSAENDNDSKTGSTSSHSSVTNENHSDLSDCEVEIREFKSPRPFRKSTNHTEFSNLNFERSVSSSNNAPDPNDDLSYIDTLPEEVKLVEVTSNLWGTKFKIHGLAKTVPANLGQVTYKTSFLHLQPRQMTLVITELRDDFPMGPDPTFNPNIFSEDEDENAQTSTIVKRLNPNDSAPIIAPMSPGPSRFPSRMKNSHLSKSDKKGGLLGPLAKAETYEEISSQKENISENHNNSASKPIRPKHIETSIASACRPGPSYSSFVAQYGRSSSNGGGQSRHAISPLCCEGSVPTLQSPKNAVGPSDTIFERPPALQTSAIMSYPNGNDYLNNIVHIKSNISGLSNEQLKMNAQSSRDNVKSTNREIKSQQTKKKDIEYIDDVDSPTTPNGIQSPNETNLRRTSTIVSISPACVSASMTRSCSMGYLDSVEMVPSDVALSILRKDTPNKRLVLVDRKPAKKSKQHDNNVTKKMKLVQCGKSKSLDSCELKEIPIKSNGIETPNVMPKLCETHESETDSPTHNTKTRNQRKLIETSIMSSLPSTTMSDMPICPNCHNATKLQQCEQCRKTSNHLVTKQCKTVSNSLLSNCKSSGSNYADPQNNTKFPNKFEQLLSESIKASGSKSYRPSFERKAKPTKKNTEVITSYTDSPLFSRKHRFGDDASSSRYMGTDNRSSPLLCRKFETGISLLKQFSEARKRKKEENSHLIKADSQNDLQQSAATETKSSIALHTQALATLENIISGNNRLLIAHQIQYSVLHPVTFPLLTN